MNGTVIDIPGIFVSVNTISLEHSTDKAHTISIRDSHGNIVTVSVVYGKIELIENKIK